MFFTMAIMANWIEQIDSCHVMKWFNFLMLRLSLRAFLCVSRLIKGTGLGKFFTMAVMANWIGQIERRGMVNFSYAAFKSRNFPVCFSTH